MENLIRTDLIVNYMNENGLSKTQFCKLCKISVSTFNRILNGENIRLISLFRIAKTMKVKLHQLCRQK